MLFTFWYVILTWYWDWQEKQDKMKILQLIREYAQKSALQVRRKHKSSLSSVDEPDGSTCLLENLKNCHIYSTKHQRVTRLNEWTSYFDQENKPDSTFSSHEDHCCIKVTTRHPKDETKFLEKVLATPTQKMVKFSQHVVPFAWKSGDHFEILAECSEENLATIIDAFNKERLITDEMLEILSIQTILPVGHAKKLIRNYSYKDVTPLLASPQPKSSRTSNLNLNLETHREVECDHSESVFVEETVKTPVTIVPKNLTSPSVSSPTDHTQDGRSAVTGDHSGRSNVHRTSMKPPNIVIYCGKKDSNRLYEAAKKTIELCLNPDRYLLYHLKHDDVNKVPWADNTSLLFICSDKVYDGVDHSFYDYFMSGGKVVSFCSAFDNQFVNKEQISSSVGITKINYKNHNSVPVICGRHVYSIDTHVDMMTGFKVAEEGHDLDGKPVILRVQQKDSTGVCLLTQVNLDKDPIEMAVSPQAFLSLKENNEARFLILKDLLCNIGIDTEMSSTPDLTPAYLLPLNQDKKKDLLSGLKPSSSGILRSRTTSLQLVSQLGDVSVTADMLPVITEGAPQKFPLFDMDTYRRHLDSKVLGQVVLYTDVVTSTMPLLDSMMFSCPEHIGLVAIAGRQTQGKGRGGNAWISPPGCAMCTVQVRIPFNSLLGQRSAFIQHIMSLAVVESVRRLPGYQDIDLQLKWPNDIYYKNKIKLGGVIVSSTIMNNMIYASIGCGFNVSNSNPTMCINDVIEQYNCYHGTHLEPLDTSQLLARSISILEELLEVFQKHGRQPFLDLYYNRWMHGATKVTLQSLGQEVDIIGLDHYGYLLVKTPEGDEISLQPDGNSFDILRNLIVFKPT